MFWLLELSSDVLSVFPKLISVELRLFDLEPSPFVMMYEGEAGAV